MELQAFIKAKMTNSGVKLFDGRSAILRFALSLSVATSVLQFPSATSFASTINECEQVFSEHSPLFVERTETIFKIPIHYNFNADWVRAAISVKHLDLENALVISFASNGHAMIWFDGWRIDSQGSPFFDIHNFSREQAVVPTGILFVKRNLPPEFKEQFHAYLRQIKSKWSATCVSSACRSLADLQLSELAPSRYIRATSLLRHLLRYYATLPPEEQKGYSIYSIGDSMSNYIKAFRQFESAVVVSSLVRFAIFGGPPVAGTGKYTQ